MVSAVFWVWSGIAALVSLWYAAELSAAVARRRVSPWHPELLLAVGLHAGTAALAIALGGLAMRAPAL